MGMDAYALKGGGLDVNLLGRCGSKPTKIWSSPPWRNRCLNSLSTTRAGFFAACA